ncbi:MAG: dihydroxyacetone kinase subunit DhaL [Gammaproteobacteria bacterium]
MTLAILPLIDAAIAAIRTDAEHLTALDQAIGDGDHGINMKRGFDALHDARAELSPLAPGAALQKAGMILVMKVGGASGPLYGSLLMGLGKALPDAPTLDDTAIALDDGIAAVKKRGKSSAGEKTLLDVLEPTSAALHAGLAQGLAGAELARRVAAAAAAGLATTQPMRATKGRAAFLGERSIGHLDPGAASSCLLIQTICNTLEGMA